MTQTNVATARDYKTILQCAPDDAGLARVIFKDIQDDVGATLTRSLAGAIAFALLKEGSVGESVEVLDYARDKGVQWV
ncbi:uncharacterized protein IUM83_09718 [Phytophthora cinnamomi]|uniref:uncharacterized protein n=1 Tax=Phytophthora cinnamomi TaxID=4785 RepID=UPI003559923C|nr:hypothetical protein IUM83_09718 [Phytophthora cinnamomi]